MASTVLLDRSKSTDMSKTKKKSFAKTGSVREIAGESGGKASDEPIRVALLRSGFSKVAF